MTGTPVVVGNDLLEETPMIGGPEMMFIGLVCLIPLFLAIWIITTINGIRRGIERIANSMEGFTRSGGTPL